MSEPKLDGGRDIQLILDYRVARTCSVHPNCPDPGVIGNDIGWTITTTDIVGWRYNVNDTWAMVSDKKYRNDPHGHPWWGFIERNCIGALLLPSSTPGLFDQGLTTLMSNSATIGRFVTRISKHIGVG